MKPIPVESQLIEEGLLYNVVRVDVDSYEPYEAIDFIKPGLCKVIIQRDKLITRTHYFKNGMETSKDRILHDERIKNLNR